MFRTTAVPDWFKSTPFYITAQRQARADAEATRGALAAERAVIVATEAKEAPKRQRPVDAARQLVEKTKAAHADALAALQHASGEAARPANAASYRVSAIDSELRRLANPAIGRALDQVFDVFERTRNGASTGMTHQLDAIDTARKALESCYVATGFDADREVTEILRKIGITDNADVAA